MMRTRLLVAILGLILVASNSMTASAQCIQCVFDGVRFWCQAPYGTGYNNCSSGYIECTAWGSCGGGTCFLGGTLVETENGSIPIEQLQAGDTVLTWTQEGGVSSGTVESIHRTEAYAYYVINDRVRATTDHPFLANGTWTKVSDLRVGSKLLRIDGTTEVVQSIDYTEKGVRVFNLSVEFTQSFFAEGYLVHNKTTPKDP